MNLTNFSVRVHIDRENEAGSTSRTGGGYAHDEGRQAVEDAHLGTVVESGIVGNPEEEARDVACTEDRSQCSEVLATTVADLASVGRERALDQREIAFGEPGNESLDRGTRGVIGVRTAS